MLTNPFLFVLVGELPVLLKGPWHLLRFTIAMWCMQSFPKDMFFQIVEKCWTFRLVMGSSVALYKL